MTGELGQRQSCRKCAFPGVSSQGKPGAPASAPAPTPPHPHSPQKRPLLKGTLKKHVYFCHSGVIYRNCVSYSIRGYSAPKIGLSPDFSFLSGV